jgi:hypothetical protein
MTIKVTPIPGDKGCPLLQVMQGAKRFCILKKEKSELPFFKQKAKNES